VHFQKLINNPYSRPLLLALGPLLVLCFISKSLWAAPFEIKIHDELIAELHESGYEIETNLFQASAAQGIKSDVFQTRVEYAYGIAQGNEIGANVFLSNYNGVSYVNGGKLSQMYIPTHDEDGIFHYGIKNEIVYLKDIGTENQLFWEMTPILALQLQKWRFTLNPSIDFGLNKSGGVSFAPSGKIAYAVTAHTSIGGEYYSEMSNTTNTFPISQRFNTAYLVVDTKIDKSTINFGVGKGTSLNSDNWVMKLIAAIAF